MSRKTRTEDEYLGIYRQPAELANILTAGVVPEVPEGECLVTSFCQNYGGAGCSSRTCTNASGCQGWCDKFDLVEGDSATISSMIEQHFQQAA